MVAELWAEVDRLYENAVPSRSELSGMEDPRASFVIARLHGEAVGCGAIRPLTEVISEVKRVYVEPHARRTGVARAIMNALEQLARETGFSEIWWRSACARPLRSAGTKISAIRELLVSVATRTTR